MTAKTLSQWWKAAFLCFTLAIPTAFVVNKEAGWFVSFLGAIYLAVAVILSAVHIWTNLRAWLQLRNLAACSFCPFRAVSLESAITGYTFHFPDD